MIRPLALLLAAFAILAQPARADDYPTRPVRLIVGFAAGSSGDVIARIVAHKLSELLNQNVIVEDKPGASSMVATDYVARSANDGYTLMFATIATTINMTLFPDKARNVVKDMTPVALVGSIPNILVVNPQLGVGDVKGLIALAKQKPDELLYGASGLGSGPHVATELFKQMAGVKMTGVLYPGSGQTAVDLIA
ncbi:MAG: tripartite tricarboxylate transporter substrate-binding protein, partial [Hyphomicrobiales bacterium]